MDGIKKPNSTRASSFSEYVRRLCNLTCQLDEVARLGPLSLTSGVNFSLYSRTATGVELLFFDREDDRTLLASFGSIRLGIALITIGTCACQACARDRSTAIGSTGHRIPAQRAAI